MYCKIVILSFIIGDLYKYYQVCIIEDRCIIGDRACGFQIGYWLIL